jgi:hypothetical protein
MSDWEVHDLGVQIVRRHLDTQNCKVTSCQSMLDINPSIWFEREGNLNWCVVRTAPFPALAASRSVNLDAIAESWSPLSPRGNFASVALASIDDPYLGAKLAMPLDRGHGVNARFTGLEPLTAEATPLKGMRS